MRLKLFGLVALSAIAALASLGASSATATNTQLCKEKSATLACPAGQAATTGHWLATAPIVVTPVATWFCDYGLLEGTLLGLASPQIYHGSLIGIKCDTTLGGGCTVKEVSAGGLWKVLKLAKELGEVTGEYEINVVCGKIINCNYGGEGLVGHLQGPEITGVNDTITYKEALLKKTGGFLCPATAKLTATYENLTRVYVRS